MRVPLPLTQHASRVLARHIRRVKCSCRLRSRALTTVSAGCKIRVLIGDPEGNCIKVRGTDEQFGHGIASRCEVALMHYRPLMGQPGVSVHLHDTTLYNSIYRFDDDMLVNAHLYATNAYAAPVLHLRRLAAGELFANYLQSFEAVWERSTPATA